MRKVKTALKWLLPVCVLFGIFLTSLVLFRDESSAFFSTSSPKSTYVVSLTGNKDKPAWPIFTNSVRVNVIKDRKTFLTNKYVHAGDWMDPSFEILYPRNSWVDDNVLHFYREEYFKEGKSDALIIVNNTNEIVKYLRVVSENMYLLFDLEPASVTRLPVASPRGDFKWINIEGEFCSGRNIEKTGANFSKEQGGHLSNYIYINPEGVVIESPRFDKYKSTE